MSEALAYRFFYNNGDSKVVVVDRDGRESLLPHTVLHSPDGLSWGYHGSGPTDLAWNLFAHVVGESDLEEIEPFAARLFLDEVVSQYKWGESHIVPHAYLAAWVDSKESEYGDES